MKSRTIMMVVLIALVTIFILQNISAVSVEFLFFTISMPRALLLSITLCVGVVIGFLLKQKSN